MLIYFVFKTEKNTMVKPFGADCQAINLPLHRRALDKQSFRRGSTNVVECRPLRSAHPFSDIQLIIMIIIIKIITITLIIIRIRIIIRIILIIIVFITIMVVI